MNTIIEKIRAEIKIRLSANGAFDEEGDSAWHYDQGMIAAYQNVLSVLSDLEKAEKPSEGLEEEINNYTSKHFFGSQTQGFFSSRTHGDIDCVDIVLVARHFAKWQKEQMISALKNDGELPTEFIDKFHEIDRTAFQNGQANMKVQFMKEAVEGIVTTRSMAGNIVTAHIDHQFKDGQKVKLIIVKED